MDLSQQSRAEKETIELDQRREQASLASGQLVAATLNLAGRLLSSSDEGSAHPAKLDALAAKLSQCVERDEFGCAQLKITLSDQSALGTLAETLAELLQ